MADRGAETIVPKEEWDKIKNEFQETINASDFQTAFLDKLKNCQAIFSKYIPSTEDDINELPDNLDIDL